MTSPRSGRSSRWRCSLGTLRRAGSNWRSACRRSSSGTRFMWGLGRPWRYRRLVGRWSLGVLGRFFGAGVCGEGSGALGGPEGRVCGVSVSPRGGCVTSWAGPGWGGAGSADTAGRGREKSCTTRQFRAEGRGLSCYPGSSWAARQGSALKSVLTRYAGFRACDRGDCRASGQHRQPRPADRRRRGPGRDRIPAIRRLCSPSPSWRLSDWPRASDPHRENASRGARMWRERGSQPSLGGGVVGHAARGRR